MPIVSLNNFARAGLNTDLIPWDLPGDYATELENVRITNNSIHPFGGHKETADIPNDTVVGTLLFMKSQLAKYWVIAGNNKIYHFDGTFTEKKDVNVSDPYLFTISALADIPIVNHPNTGPMYINSSIATYADLPWEHGKTWASENESCEIMRSHKQFLFALRITTKGEEHTDAVRWSSPADIGGVPPSWNHLDPAQSAGFTSLGGTGGSIIDGLSMRDSFVVYREGGISVFDYVGGNYVWRIRHLSSSAGLLAKDCVADVNGTHYFIGDGDIYRNDGNTVQSIIHNKIKTRFRKDIDPDNYDKSFVTHYPLKSEVWFCVPRTGFEYANIAYVYNYIDDTWSIRDLPLTVKADYGADQSEPFNWDSLHVTWDGIDRSWSEKQVNPFDYNIISLAPKTASSPAKILSLDSPLGLNIQPFGSKIERTAYALEGVQSVTTIQRVYPHVNGSQKVYVQIGSHQTPGSPVLWKAPTLFDPSKDKKVDVRSTGALHAFRIYSEDVVSDFAVSGIQIEYVEAGRR